MGFTKIWAMDSKFNFGDTSISRTIEQHGHGDRLTVMGTVSSYVFQHKSEPTLYWLEDTEFNDSIKENIINFTPIIKVTHSCWALWSKDEFPVVMDDRQTWKFVLFHRKQKS